jgi:hypothetical protein
MKGSQILNIDHHLPGFLSADTTMVIEQGAKLGAQWRQHVQAQAKRVRKGGSAV